MWKEAIETRLRLNIMDEQLASRYLNYSSKSGHLISRIDFFHYHQTFSDLFPTTFAIKLNRRSALAGTQLSPGVPGLPGLPWK
jgi:hypothetical protein